MSIESLHNTLQQILMAGLANSAAPPLSDSGDALYPTDKFAPVDFESAGVGERPSPRTVDAELATRFLGEIANVGDIDDTTDEGRAYLSIVSSLEGDIASFITGLLAGLESGARQNMPAATRWISAVVVTMLRRGSTLLQDAGEIGFSAPPWASVVPLIEGVPGSQQFREAVAAEAGLAEEIKGAFDFMAASNDPGGRYDEVFGYLFPPGGSSTAYGRQLLVAGQGLTATTIAANVQRILDAGTSAQEHGTIIGEGMSVPLATAIATLLCGVTRVPLELTGALSADATIASWHTRAVEESAGVARLRHRLRSFTGLGVLLTTAGGPLRRGMDALYEQVKAILDLSSVVRPYEALAPLKQKFNSVAIFFGSEAVVKLTLLTAHRIISETLFNRFETEWESLGWLRRVEMPAILIPIDPRYGFPAPASLGTSVLDDPFILAVPEQGEIVSKAALEGFLAQQEAAAPFPNVSAAIDAHRSWYQSRFAQFVNASGIPVWGALYAAVLRAILAELDRVKQVLADGQVTIDLTGSTPELRAFNPHNSNTSDQENAVSGRITMRAVIEAPATHTIKWMAKPANRVVIADASAPNPVVQANLPGVVELTVDVNAPGVEKPVASTTTYLCVPQFFVQEFDPSVSTNAEVVTLVSGWGFDFFRMREIAVDVARHLTRNINIRLVEAFDDLPQNLRESLTYSRIDFSPDWLFNEDMSTRVFGLTVPGRSGETGPDVPDELIDIFVPMIFLHPQIPTSLDVLAAAGSDRDRLTLVLEDMLGRFMGSVMAHEMCHSLVGPMYPSTDDPTHSTLEGTLMEKNADFSAATGITFTAPQGPRGVVANFPHDDTYIDGRIESIVGLDPTTQAAAEAWFPMPNALP